MDKNRFCLKFDVRAQAAKKGEVMIYSAITPYKWDEDDPDVTSRDFDAALKALGDIEELTVRINSPGGSVYEASAIRSALIKHPSKKTVDIDGLCASAATMIACLPGARVRMARGGEYMIHCASLIAIGNAAQLDKAAESLRVTDGNIAKIYAEKTGMTEEECLGYMRDETWMDVDRAMELGFVDEIIEQDGAYVSDMVAQADMERLNTLKTAMAQTFRKASEREIDIAAALCAGKTEDIPAEEPTVNTFSEGETDMDVTNMTAEEFSNVNPSAAAEIASRAVAAERERIAQIDDLTPPGQSWAELAKTAKETGVSAQDFFKDVLRRTREAKEAFLDARTEELKPTAQVGAGDTADNDKADTSELEDKAAKDIAAFAKDINVNGVGMA